MNDHGVIHQNNHESVSNPALFIKQQSHGIQQSAVKGAAWKILSCLAFASLNALVRYLTGGAGGSTHPLSPSQLVCLQNVVGCIFLLPSLFHYGLKSFTTTYPLMHGVRVICGVLGMIALYYAFKHMPVALAVSLQFTGPIFATLGAWLYLREHIGLYRFLGIIAGLVGAFIITRPDQAFSQGVNYTFNWTYLLPIGAALGFTIAKLLGRELALKGEPARVLTAYLVFFMIPASLIPALHQWVWPTYEQWGYIGLLGFCAWGGHYAMAKSYGYADVLFLMPFGFSRIILSALIAWLAFTEIPKSHGFWLGSSVIFVSTLFITFGEKKAMNKFKK